MNLVGRVLFASTIHQSILYLVGSGVAWTDLLIIFRVSQLQLKLNAAYIGGQLTFNCGQMYINVNLAE